MRHAQKVTELALIYHHFEINDDFSIQGLTFNFVLDPVYYRSWSSKLFNLSSLIFSSMK